jgi:hypothetical protein
MREVSLLLEIEVKERRMGESERLYRAGFGVKVRDKRESKDVADGLPCGRCGIFFT